MKLNLHALFAAIALTAAFGAAPLAGQTPTCFTVTGTPGAIYNVYSQADPAFNVVGVLPTDAWFCVAEGCYVFALQSAEGALESAGLIGPDGVPVPLSGYADDTYYQTIFTVGGILGCGDSAACNYDPAVTCTAYEQCSYDCYGCTDETAFNYDPTATADDGTCCTTHWATVESEGEVGVWFYNTNGFLTGAATGEPFCLNPGCYQFTAYALDNVNADFQVVLEDGSVVVSGNTGDLDPNVTVPLEMEAVLGCTHTLACNFDSGATCDDGTCEFASCAGCTDASATNFDPEATYDDGTCCFGEVGTVTATGAGYWSVWSETGGGSYGMGPGEGVVCLAPGCLVFSCSVDFTMPPLPTPVTFVVTGPDGAILVEVTTESSGYVPFTYGDAVPGCLDSGACNFNPEATCADWSLCDYGCYGCTDPAASNYDPEATFDTGECCFGPWYTVETTGPVEWYVSSSTSWSGYGADGFCYPDGCFTLHAWSLTVEPFELTITAPDGSLFYSSDGNANPYLYAFFTDGEVIGCTDPSACNFAPDATCADYALCDYGCYGCTDPAAANFDPEATWDDGTCCASEFWYTVEASGDLLFLGGNTFGNAPYDSGFCVQSGCFLYQAYSYLPEAISYSVTAPDGSVVVEGTVENFSAGLHAVASDGQTVGCTDPLACNYDAEATCDPGTCTYYCGGCLDPGAINYWPEAEFEDGSCFYGLATPNIGMVLVPDGNQFYVAANWSELSSTYAVVPSNGTSAWMAADEGTALHGPYPCGTSVAFHVHDMNAGMALAMTSPTFTLECSTAIVGDLQSTAGTLKAYPNPTAAALTIDGCVAGSTWSLFDSSGRTAATGLHTGGLLTLDASSLPSGLYLFRSGDRAVKVEVR
jgi:hypothetical protein